MRSRTAKDEISGDGMAKLIGTWLHTIGMVSE
jgi:hypothetical protein